MGELVGIGCVDDDILLGDSKPDVALVVGGLKPEVVQIYNERNYALF